MNTYMKLKLHLERHVFKRGQHKGDAPAGKRWRTYVRVVKGNDDSMRVRMYGTDLLTAYPDGRVVLDTNGWYDRPTTKLRINEAFGFIPHFYMRLSSRKVFGISQPTLYIGGKTYLYYDGMELGADGTITSPLRTFERKRVNREESKELREDMAACGFKDAFNVLWAVSNPEESGYRPDRLRNVVTFEHHSNYWANVVAAYTWTRYYSYNQSKYVYAKREPREAWDALMQTLRKDCYEVVKTDVTHL